MYAWGEPALALQLGRAPDTVCGAGLPVHLGPKIRHTVADFDVGRPDASSFVRLCNVLNANACMLVDEAWQSA